MDFSGRLPHAFTTPGSSSFVEFLANHAPDLLPSHRVGTTGAAGHAAPAGPGAQLRAREARSAWSWRATAAPRWAR